MLPHIRGDVEIETSVEKPGQGDVPRITIITLEEWEARMKACEVMVKLIDRKSKLLGWMRRPRVNKPLNSSAETEEHRLRL